MLDEHEARAVADGAIEAEVRERLSSLPCVFSGHLLVYVQGFRVPRKA
jgi:hypothetical protein